MENGLNTAEGNHVGLRELQVFFFHYVPPFTTPSTLKNTLKLADLGNMCTFPPPSAGTFCGCAYQAHIMDAYILVSEL